jgi:hypothetical protein
LSCTCWMPTSASSVHGHARFEGLEARATALHRSAGAFTTSPVIVQFIAKIKSTLSIIASITQTFNPRTALDIALRVSGGART